MIVGSIWTADAHIRYIRGLRPADEAIWLRILPALVRLRCSSYNPCALNSLCGDEVAIVRFSAGSVGRGRAPAPYYNKVSGGEIKKYGGE